MQETLKRLFVAGTAIASLSAALVLSGGAQAKPYTAGNGTGSVQSEPTNVSPGDHDASIRGQGA